MSITTVWTLCPLMPPALFVAWAQASRIFGRPPSLLAVADPENGPINASFRGGLELLLPGAELWLPAPELEQAASVRATSAVAATSDLRATFMVDSIVFRHVLQILCHPSHVCNTRIVTQNLREGKGALRLADRLTADSGRHFLPGLQALVRFPLEQARLDRAAGLRIATFISGYPGSPLAGYDLALSRIPDVLADHDVTLVPAGNEELAATAHMGTQMLDEHPHASWDGVTAIWYGKGPGIDRSGDALKHGNFAGTSAHGAVVILSGEDHEAKSSTMPFQQEYAFTSAGIPVLYPASVAEFRSYGLHAIRCSRYSGCWIALKLVSALCDGGESLDITPQDVPGRLPDLELNGVPFAKRTDFTFFPGRNIEMERHLYAERHRAVLAYASINEINQVLHQGPGDTVGIVTAGKSFADVEQALSDLGLQASALDRSGIRILKLGLIYPLDEELVRSFASGLGRIIVVEEKRSLIEVQLREELYGTANQPVCIGKKDEKGNWLFPVKAWTPT